MKKLIINEKWAERLLEEELWTLEKDLEIDLVNYQMCNISHFRKLLHTVIDLDNTAIDKEKLHKEVSENNFTQFILTGIVEVANKLK